MRWVAKRVAEGDAWHVDADGREVTVHVALGAELLPRLERAVADALGVTLAPPPSPPAWRVKEEAYSHGDLYELEQDTSWTVVNERTGQPLWEFRGGTSHVLEGGGWSAATGSHGCDEVVLGADGRHVLARDSDEVKCHPLAEDPATR
jgi:hypothetical protein